jgi:6-phosphogluconolactonase
VLTGGGIAAKALAAVARSPARGAVDWRRLDVWWGDERFLPVGDPERNETQAREALLDAVPLDDSRVHPMPPSDGPDGNDPEAVRGSPKPPPVRISLTIPTIQASREVWVVVAGEDKAKVVNMALSGAGPQQVPAAAARGSQRTLWLLDRGAAAALPASLGRLASP